MTPLQRLGRGITFRDEGNARVAVAETDEFAKELVRRWNAYEEMREALEFIRDYPPKGASRRTDDGYPAEVIYDEYAYQRMVDSYRDAARRALARTLTEEQKP